MQRNATKSAATKTIKRSNHPGMFHPAVDSRKRKIRGLWIRNGKYYAQMRIDAGNGKTRPVRVPLEAADLDAAKNELEKARTENRKGEMHQPGHRPKFEALVADYTNGAEFLSKKEGTRENEAQALQRWVKALGGLRIDWIKPAHLADYRNARRKVVTARTVNLDMTAFNNAMKYAVTKGWISTPPRLPKLKEETPAKRPLLAPADVQKLLDACVEENTKNAAELRFYLRFLALTGAREQEALKTRWQAVDIAGLRVTISETKNRQHRTLDASPELVALLEEMKACRPPDSSYLFPSPQRGEKDIPAKSLRESLRLVRKAAELPWVGFHDLRHFFASTCVMAGIDFMLIAEWLGHSDGGILVGKVYGHLADSHKRKAAAGLSLLSVPANVTPIAGKHGAA